MQERLLDDIDLVNLEDDSSELGDKNQVWETQGERLVNGLTLVPKNTDLVQDNRAINPGELTYWLYCNVKIFLSQYQGSYGRALRVRLALRIADPLLRLGKSRLSLIKSRQN